MKTKEFGKKLSLNKKTISHLDNQEMNDVQGGTGTCVSMIYLSCSPTCDCTILSLCCAIT
jgi:natural product precursor